jgi:hypothetical protein
LHADSLAVNYAHPSPASTVRLFEIVFHHRTNLPGRDRVQVDHILEFDDDYIWKWVVKV